MRPSLSTRLQGSLPGSDNILDLNQINPDKNKRKTFEKLFGKIKKKINKTRPLNRQVQLAQLL